jgi:hypothetical protein
MFLVERKISLSWMMHGQILDGIDDWRATGSMLQVPYYLALKAEALHLVERTSEALEAIREAEALAEEREEKLVECRIAPAPRRVSYSDRC